MSFQSKNGHHSFKQEKANSSCMLVVYKRKAISISERGQGAGPTSLGRWDQNQGNVIESDQPEHCHRH